MKVLIVGSGGREHALAWKLRQSPLVTELLAAPGNGGTAMECRNVSVGAGDVPGLVDLARKERVDLVVAGPEEPLVLGLRDVLDREGVPCFGPDAFCAQLEGSKAFAKKIMREAGVPTADFQVFDSCQDALAHVRTRPLPLVVKADGLAAGKGVSVCRTREEAVAAVEAAMRDRIFGAAGDRVVVEDALAGEEASFLAFCDGEHVLPLPSSQDHKPVGDNDTGPNTGGMGAYSPAPILPESEVETVADLAIRPVVRRMAELGHPFRGVLYAGMMRTAQGWSVLEYNVRFGDPEAQPLLARLDADLAEIMLASVEGRLDHARLACLPETSLCVVMTAKGYPGAYPKGMLIRGIERAEELRGVKVFLAGAQMTEAGPVTSGGRVLGVTALAADLRSAQALAYRAVERIEFENSYCRRDIGAKGLR